FNRLTQWDAGSNGQEQYVYDVSGNRVLKRSTSGGTTSLTAYAFGLQELSYTGNGVATGQIAYYSLAGHLVGSTDGSSTTDELTDAQGSVLTSISQSAVLGEQVYGPYGNQRYVQGTLGTTRGYTGQFHDSVTGLDYYNARYYDPVVGVFVSPDSVQGNAQGMDPYAYVKGNPETATDPTGQRIIGEHGNYGNIDPDGNVSMFNPFPTYGSGGGYNEQGNYAYHHFFYTKNVMKQPAQHDDPTGKDSPWNKISHALGIPQIQNIVNNPHLNIVQKTLGVAGVVTNDALNIVQGVNIMLNGPVALLMMVGTDAVLSVASALFMTPAMWRSTMSNNAPTVSPGNRVIRGIHVDDLGNGEPYCAVYDCFGRQIGRTDVDDLNGIHYHAYAYDTSDAINGATSIKGYPQAIGDIVADHEPGVYDPYEWTSDFSLLEEGITDIEAFL
ncbi:MAG TPA: RHS repeat-associated core domain-containing protein, partial [Ktedonobacteraceae bacterium]|nr:RHS repeat-associated core domain-containing protein [Ktedonobacteraceae bacterium]